MPSKRKSLQAQSARYAPVFAALGDETRLSLVAKLAAGTPQSITQLSDGMDITRQAVTRHLRVLEDVGVVRSSLMGRENLFELDMRPFKDLQDYLGFVSDQWDCALSRLKMFVEDDEDDD